MVEAHDAIDPAGTNADSEYSAEPAASPILRDIDEYGPSLTWREACKSRRSDEWMIGGYPDRDRKRSD